MPDIHLLLQHRKGHAYICLHSSLFTQKIHAKNKSELKRAKHPQVSGGVTYNGRRTEEFAVHRTAGCVEQRDVHIPLLTVRETLDFAARCQGAAHRPGMHFHQPYLPVTRMLTCTWYW